MSAGVEDDGVMTQGTLEPLIASRIELLIGALGTATKVAQCLRVTRPMLSKWRAGTVMPSPAQLKLLLDLDHVMARASLIYVPKVTYEWLVGHNSYLEGARPVDVLHVRGVQEVLDALDAGEQLAYGG
jgi:transcriptional regulator with XRE-family HTH domain